MAGDKVFEKSVKGHGQGHMLKVYGTIGRPCHKEHTCKI